MNNDNGITMTEGMKTGIPLIDTQHGEYIRRLNTFLDKYHADQVDQETFKQELDFILNYAYEHFEAEEALMTHSKFPEKDEHIKLHNYFRNTAYLFSDMQYSEENVASVLKLLADWFLSHIITHDFKLAKHLKTCNSQR